MGKERKVDQKERRPALSTSWPGLDLGARAKPHPSLFVIAAA